MAPMAHRSRNRVLLPVAAAALSACSVEWNCGPASYGETVLTTYSKGTYGTLSLDEEAKRTDVEALDLRGVERVVLDTDYGSVDVAGSSDGAGGDAAAKVQAELVAAGRDQDEARAILDRFQLHVERDSKDLVVRVSGEPYVIEEGNTTAKIVPRVSMSLAIPDSVAIAVRTRSGEVRVVGPVAALDVESGYGDVDVRGVNGSLRLDLGSGNATARSVVGDEIAVQSSYGAVVLSEAQARSMHVSTKSGDVRVESVSADELVVESGYGSIDLKSVKGEVRAESSSGEVRLSGGDGSHASLVSRYGNVRVEGVGGDLDLETASGSIFVRDARGTLRALSGYGDLDLEGVIHCLEASSKSGNVRVRATEGSAIRENWKLDSQYGTVELALPGALDCDLDLETGYGKLSWDFSMTIDPGSSDDDHHITGRMGSGGSRLRMHTGSGDVKLLQAER